MEILLALSFGVILAAGAYLIMSRNLLRVVLGLILFSNAANVAIFLSGRLKGAAPPLVGTDAATLASDAANPLPQALILTAIVIGFALISFVSVLVYRAYGALGTLDTEGMREAEPAGEPPMPGAAQPRPRLTPTSPPTPKEAA